MKEIIDYCNSKLIPEIVPLHNGEWSVERLGESWTATSKITLEDMVIFTLTMDSADEGEGSVALTRKSMKHGNPYHIKEIHIHGHENAQRFFVRDILG